VGREDGTDKPQRRGPLRPRRRRAYGVASYTDWVNGADVASAPFTFAATGIRGADSRIGRRGWVVETGGCVAGWARPFENPALVS
jgi:hypothetical protein